MTGRVARQYRYRAYPTGEQLRVMELYAAGVRAFWNRNVAWLRVLDEDHDGLGPLYAWVRHYGDVKLRRQLDGDFAAAVRQQREAGMTFWHDGTEHALSDVPATMLHGACGTKGQLRVAVSNSLKKRQAGEAAELPGFRSRGRPRNLRWQVQAGTVNAAPADLVRVAGNRMAIVQLRAVPGYKGNKGLHVRYHRPLPADAEVSFVQVHWSLDAGTCHVIFTVTTALVPEPARSGTVGIDRGIAVCAATSDGERYDTPGLPPGARWRLLRLRQGLARKRRDNPCRQRPCQHGKGECWKSSRRYAAQRAAIARLLEREGNLASDGAHKFSRSIASRYATVVIEELSNLKSSRSARGTIAEPGINVRAKAGLNREQRAAAWGRLEMLLRYKAAAVAAVPAAYTSQTCLWCGHVSGANRKSQMVFSCNCCGLGGNADVLAAQNIRNGYTAGARPVDARESCHGSSQQPANTHNSTGSRRRERSGDDLTPGERSQAGSSTQIITDFEGTVIPATWGIPSARSRGRRRRS